MQDNELDELFRSKLGGLEMQPSAHVWDNINAGLGGEKKRAWTPRLSIAAALLAMLSVGAWFLSGKPAKVEQGQVAGRVKKVDAVKQLQPENQTVLPVVEQQTKPAIAQHQATNSLASVKRKNVIKKPAASTPTLTENKSVNTAPENYQSQQVLAAVPVSTMSNRVVPEVALTTKTIDTLPSAMKSINPVSALAVTAQQPEKKKRRGIHSLGGIINAVVAAVDKREDKFIEFTETDEDNANITGLNLGLIKVKKEK